MVSIGKLAVVLDVAVRCAVIAVSWSLLREFRAEEIEPNGDGVPVRLLVVPLGIYILWNVWVIVRSGRAWRAGSIDARGFLAELGALSAARLVWLLPLAGDLWYRRSSGLMVLVVASVVCTILALGEAVRLSASARAEVTPPGRP